MKNLKTFNESVSSRRAEYNKLLEEIKELIYKHAVPYKGSHTYNDGVKPDRILEIHQPVSVSEFDLEYKYLESIYTKENIPNTDEYNNIIEGFYNVEYTNIFLDDETYKKYMSGELKSEYVDTSTSTIAKKSPILLDTSFIFYKVDELKSILEAIKRSIK